MKRLLLIMGLVITLNACSTHITDFTMISTKNINIENKNLDNLPKQKNIIGEDKKGIFVIIPFGRPTIQAAVNDALTKGNGDLLVDASLDTEGWWFIFGEFGYKVKGTVINTKGETR